MGLFDALFCNALVDLLGTCTQLPIGWAVKGSLELNYGLHVPQLPLESLAACLLPAFLQPCQESMNSLMGLHFIFRH